jgi:hypothetical protein
MRTRRRATIEDLRLAIDCLPRRTRVAMLDGIANNDIIVGAYTNRDGICPMLAAHRAGGRTSLIAFAQAWDRVAFRGVRHARARRATERELLILRSHLEASLLGEDAPVSELAAARREHLDLMARRQAQPEPAPDTADHRSPQRRPASERPGDPDRAPELRRRAGWSWTRVVRRYDEYERLLRRVQDEAAPSDAPAPVPAGSRLPR